MTKKLCTMSLQVSTCTELHSRSVPVGPISYFLVDLRPCPALLIQLLHVISRNRLPLPYTFSQEVLEKCRHDDCCFAGERRCGRGQQRIRNDAKQIKVALEKKNLNVLLVIGELGNSLGLIVGSIDDGWMADGAIVRNAVCCFPARQSSMLSQLRKGGKATHC